MDIDLLLEIFGTVLNLGFLFFIIKEKKIAWVFGILGSLVSIWLFYRTKLYAESILYIYYVAIGFYGYYLWNNKGKNNEELKITTWGVLMHVYLLVIGVILSLGLGHIFDNYTDAKNAYFDSFTTIFSFIASYMEAKKILSAWILWIILNGVTIYLYNLRELDIYAMLTLVYFVASFFGLYNWKRIYSTEQYKLNKD